MAASAKIVLIITAAAAWLDMRSPTRATMLRAIYFKHRTVARLCYKLHKCPAAREQEQKSRKRFPDGFADHLLQ